MILNGRVLKTQMYPFKNTKGVSKYSKCVVCYSKHFYGSTHKKDNQQQRVYVCSLQQLKPDNGKVSQLCSHCVENFNILGFMF